jgi:hypothetical protein
MNFTIPITASMGLVFGYEYRCYLLQLVCVLALVLCAYRRGIADR